MAQRTVKIRVQVCQAANIAKSQLDKAMHSRSPAVVSDQCVVKELLALAKERGVKVEFYGVEDTALKPKPIDPAGVKKVLEGGDPWTVAITASSTKS